MISFLLSLLNETGPSFDSAFCFSNFNIGAVKVARHMTKLSFAFHRKFIWPIHYSTKQIIGSQRVYEN